MSEIRYDIGELRRPERLPNGALRVDGYIARSGVLEYRLPDGSIRRELRTDAENERVASAWRDIVLTNGHPPVPVTPHNAKTYQVGHVGETNMDGDKLRSTLVVQDAETIARLEAGTRELSCGYRVDLDPTPGEYNGQRYDVVQTNIRPNHVAIVPAGRAGAECAVRMDGAVEIRKSDDNEDTIAVTKIKIDGVEFEVSEQAAQAVSVALEKRDAQIKEVSARADKAEVKAQAAEEARQDAEDPAKLHARVNERVALITQAKPHLPEETKFDELTDQEIRVRVVNVLGGGKGGEELNLDASAATVEAWFDVRIDQADVAAKKSDEVRKAVTPDQSRNQHNDELDPEAARLRQLERSRNAWKKSKESK